MPKRSYNQYCSIAYALDVVGERWTLLVVRELLTGPKRYTDLLNNLPGIGTNLLSARLKHLEEWDIIERENLPAPAASAVYTLTELGIGLEAVITPLWEWGSRVQSPRREEDQFRPGWMVLAMKYVFRLDRAAGIHETYEHRVGNEVFHSRIDDGVIETKQGYAEHPDLIMITDADTCFDLASGDLKLRDAIATGSITVEGSEKALSNMESIFDLPT